MKSVHLLILLGLAYFSAIQGQVLTVTTYAYFSNIVGGLDGKLCRPRTEVQYGGPLQATCDQYFVNPDPLTQGRWGRNAAAVVSGMGYQGIVASNTPVDRDFFIGRLVHFNYPINANSAASQITLNILLYAYDANGILITNSTYSFDLAIDETPNTEANGPCPYPSTIPCSDKITFQNSFNFEKRFTVGSIQYTLQMIGFKESNVSTSSPVANFISNEQQSSEAYLFARFTAACPSTCTNGGSFYIDANNNCACRCPSSACSAPKIASANCSCVCPNPNICRSPGVFNPSTCTCNCAAVTCPTPTVINSADCSCNCPTGYCGTGSIRNASTCACNCPTATCANFGETRDSRCACGCAVTCTYPKVENPSPNRCECICDPAQTCPNSNFIHDTVNCSCRCARTCSNGATVIPSNCTCGPCVGNWIKNTTTGDCTVCGISQSSCGSGFRFDPLTCQCVCDSITCDIDQGLVFESGNICGCRNCTGSECRCGNGRVEGNEQCDPAVADQCCVNCRFSSGTCNDGNACTVRDSCSGTGIGPSACRGDYNCSAPLDECSNVTCDPLVGQCVVTNQLNGTACGGVNTPCSVRCISGLCSHTAVDCGPDLNTTDCRAPACDPATGLCILVPTSGGSCNDGNSCTDNDACVAGVCMGTPRVCPVSDNVCLNTTCVAGRCVGIPVPNFTPCDFDGSLCTVGDACANGVCYPGIRTECNRTNQCNAGVCNATNGLCTVINVDDALNQTCDDANICTINDRCVRGSCAGDPDASLAGEGGLPACGAPINSSPKNVNNTVAIVAGVLGAAVLIGAIVGLAVLLKRIRDTKLLNPDTWNPDTISSIGSNPLYKGSSKSVDNRLYEG